MSKVVSIFGKMLDREHDKIMKELEEDVNASALDETIKKNVKKEEKMKQERLKKNKNITRFLKR